jgi:hypothetical protein
MSAWLLGLILFVAVALALVHYKPRDLPGIEGFDGAAVSGIEDFAGATASAVAARKEGFAVAAVDPARSPACTARSPAAQSLLARFASIPPSDEAAAELRLLISKLCCMEADITAPYAGSRTMPLQFRTSHDLEPPSTTVGRCLNQSLPQRDIDLALEKYTRRGHELLKTTLPDCDAAPQEFDAVVESLRRAFGTCQRTPPSMDHPIGVRDMGFWESQKVADLSAYKGISASP